MVKARDGKCIHCGRMEDLHAHHIKPKWSHPELKLDLENGVALCYRCHKAEHERHRPVRLRTERPRRKTLVAKIQELEDKIVMLQHKLKAMTELAVKLHRDAGELAPIRTQRKRKLTPAEIELLERLK